MPDITKTEIGEKQIIKSSKTSILRAFSLKNPKRCGSIQGLWLSMNL
jgi:hypothetical protein